MRKIILIFVSAFLIRAVFLLIWCHTGRADHLSSDSYGYYEIAQNIEHGRGFQLEGKPTARRPPLYPAFIAFFLPFASFPLGVQLAQIFVGAGSCVLLYFVGKQLFDERVGLLSAALLSFDYLSIRFVVSVMSETLFVFLLLLSFYFLIPALKSKSPGDFFKAGLIGGLAVLTRDVAIFYFPLVPLAILFLEEKIHFRMRQSLYFFLGLMLAVVPWALRNSLVFGRPMLITVSAGHTFYLANNPQTSGGRTGGDWELGLDTSYPQNPQLNLFSAEADRQLFHSGFDFIKHHPGKSLTLTAKKIVNMWRPYQTDSPLAARLLSALGYIPVMFFAGLGLIWSRHRWREFIPIYLLLIYIFSLHAVLISAIRYRCPVMPFLMIFAAYGFLEWAKKITPAKSLQVSS